MHQIRSYVEDLIKIYHYLSGMENAHNQEKDVANSYFGRTLLKITSSRKTKCRNFVPQCFSV
jgi:hypothetical protein